MAIATVPVDVYKGGYWLLKDTNPDLVFTPEKLTDEHKLMNRTAREFVANEVMPQLEHLEAKEWDRGPQAREAVRQLASWAPTRPRSTAASTSTR